MSSRALAVLKPLMSLGVLRMLGIGLAFVQAVVMARVFGAEIFGIFSFAISTVTLLGLVASLGFDQLLTREVAILDPRRVTVDALSALLRLTRLFVLPLTVIVSAGGSALLLLGGFSGFAAEYREPLLAVTLSFGLLMCRKFVEAFALGLKKAALSFVSSKVAFPAIMILGALWLDRLGHAATARKVASLYLLSLVLSTVFALVALRKDLLAFFRSDPQDPATLPLNPRVSLTAALYLTLVMAGSMVINHMDTVLLSLLSTSVEAAYAKVAWRLSEAVTLMQSIALIQLRPLIAAAYGRADQQSLQVQLHGLSKLLTVVGVAAFVVIVAFAPQLLQLFGADFVGASLSLRAYAVGALGTILGGPGTVVLSMTGNERAASRILWVVLAINLGLNLALIPRFGAAGAGVATAVSQWCMAIWTAKACRLRLGVDPSAATLARKKK